MLFQANCLPVSFSTPGNAANEYRGFGGPAHTVSPTELLWGLRDWGPHAGQNCDHIDQPGMKSLLECFRTHDREFLLEFASGGSCCC